MKILKISSSVTSSILQFLFTMKSSSFANDNNCLDEAIAMSLSTIDMSGHAFKKVEKQKTLQCTLLTKCNAMFLVFQLFIEDMPGLDIFICMSQFLATYFTLCNFLLHHLIFI